MPDTPSVVHIGENSPEQIALKLLEMVARVQKISLNAPTDTQRSDWKTAEPKWILDTYDECLRTVKLFRDTSST